MSLLGTVIVLGVVLVWGAVAVGIGYWVGTAAKLGGPEDRHAK